MTPTLPTPSAILVASAHWESSGGQAVSLASRPDTIHDFGEFPRVLSEILYPAPGAPDTGLRAINLLQQEGFAVQASPARGLDHGAWVPLSLMYPQADIPAAQVSVIRGAGPAEHLRLGRALKVIRDEGVLVIGSGALTHNLYEFRGHDIDAPVPEWVSEFDAWMKVRLESGDAASLLHYRKEAPSALRNHPTEEHLLPLFVAMGAGGDAPSSRRLHSSYEYGVLAMDIYTFE
ncbi:MAG TPA: class III extradiol ring-cleavage dioxygenase [Burkholderiaceae bacterium]|nr:class III extradiol ring-cleavage dioxygenase [Burkholderiaceae bacterium]